LASSKALKGSIKEFLYLKAVVRGLLPIAAAEVATSSLYVLVPLKKSPLKADVNEDESEGRLEISLPGEVVEYAKFIAAVRVGEVPKREAALAGELISD
jgi:hypothetical protein